ncbi:MAG: hypothetical protein OQK24_00115 [Magnetovibrio sp.]|nr:hypothetical protein [Magnetovibrio sp.]
MARLIPLLILASALSLSACASGQAAKPTPPKPTAAPVAPVKPVVPKITSQQMLGQSGPWLMTQLGKPAFTRQDQSAHIWQYKNKACVLNVFLYHDEPETLQVMHFDARHADGSNTNRDACLSKLQD